MIQKGEKEASMAYYGVKALTSIYRGAKLVWAALYSCFGGGVWASEKPWVGTDAWKNN